MFSPAISIIIPVYNSEKYLSDCLDSCLRQSPFVIGSDYEIICVNDGSTDSSNDILESYKSKGITIINQSNAGVSAARNKGLEQAQGKFIEFVDSDDCIRPNMLPRIYEMINKTGVDGCVFKFKTVEASFSQQMLQPVDLSITEGIPQLNNVFSIIIRRQYLLSHNIKFDTRMTYGEDTLFIYFIRLFRHNLIFFPESLYFYRQVDGSAMHTKTDSATKKKFNSSLIMLSEFKVTTAPSSINFLLRVHEPPNKPQRVSLNNEL